MGYCEWANINELNKVYHDKEWGIPVHDERCVCYKRIIKKYPTVNKRRDKEVY